jgi:adenylate cyclase
MLILDRQLLPSEKPLAIQDRRLRQTGYTDGEALEELGKEDLLILCKFIYQTPNLPVMNPVSPLVCHAVFAN